VVKGWMENRDHPPGQRKTVGAFLNDSIFAPLGMNSTRVTRRIKAWPRISRSGMCLRSEAIRSSSR
jgi:hypothetical protein